MGNSRTYELRRRAERQEETHRRIVAAAVELHTTLGPSQTTVQAIADTAGVTRPTVYAHFPDARSILQACSGHVRATTPLPDPDRWQAIRDPNERLEAALRDLYGYYEKLETLLENIQRDASVMPVVAELVGQRRRYLTEVRDGLLRPWKTRGSAKARLGQAIGLALEFDTWQSLVRHQGCSADEAVQLMVALARATGSVEAPASVKTPSRRAS